MSPRPRSPKHKGLPPNLYANNGGESFKYRRPDTGAWHGMGTDRHKAVQAAKQLNSLLMAGTDLVSGVMGATQTLSSFLDTYEREILPPRELAKATLTLYKVRAKQIKATFGDQPIDQITIRHIAEMLDGMTARGANQTRALLVDVFNHAASKGLCPDNPAACTIPKIEKKQRKRHTIEGLKAIREASPVWLQNAIDLALITAQRRSDVLNMKFSDVHDGGLHVVQSKTEKSSDAGWIKFALTKELAAVISRCRDDIASPYLVHRKPDRKKQSQARGKAHWTKVEERFLTRAFKEARDAAGCYSKWTEAEQPGFHEVRALSLHLYKRAGKDGQKIAGHTTEGMTRNYQKDHNDIIWSEVVADLDIKEISG
ncbi:tyrosine-type recombinase/integrase [Pseudomonas quasicaspiana]|uniref:tyrosine-type recombinase/integrase n=1 Tax=Pseudomonas quasicaspiana TaxID=2829821 RepID=UPI001E5B6D0A|nr:tyrosine-type recombinase/integrase [Pseudomonas quasicaspiana]MCD5970717.1 phage integrase Arm DNA-binding domain-containing protein [Pseudomonas quasicaspiana]